MRTQMAGAVAVAAILLLAPSSPAGEVVPYDTEDRDAWFDAVGEDGVTIGFTGFAAGTPITDQYASEGVTFFGGIDTIRFNPTALPNDEWGLDGNGDIHIKFDEPMHWIAADWPGGAFRIDLYSDEELLSQNLFAQPGFVGHFSGLYSPEPFVFAVLVDPKGDALIDDLHFAVPAPGGIVPLLFTFVYRRRRRT